MEKLGQEEDFRKVLFILYPLQISDFSSEVSQQFGVTVTNSRLVKIALNDVK